MIALPLIKKILPRKKENTKFFLSLLHFHDLFLCFALPFYLRAFSGHCCYAFFLYQCFELSALSLYKLLAFSLELSASRSFQPPATHHFFPPFAIRLPNSSICPMSSVLRPLYPVICPLLSGICPLFSDICLPSSLLYLFQPVIGRLFGNDHIVNVAFAHTGGTDL